MTTAPAARPLPWWRVWIQKEPESFRQELCERSLAALRVASILAVIIFSGMGFIDSELVTGENLVMAHTVRFVTCALFCVVIAITFLGEGAKRLSRSLSIFIVLLSGGALGLLTTNTLGANAGHHDALIVLFFSFAILPLPWKTWDLAVLYALLLLGYTLASSDDLYSVSVMPFLREHASLFVAYLTALVFHRVLVYQRIVNHLAKEDLSNVNERLRDLDAARTEFYASVSHELRTPLTLILAPVQLLLKQTPIGHPTHDTLAIAQRNALRLLRLVDDLLAIAKADVTTLQLQTEIISLNELLGELMIELEPLVTHRQVTCRLELPPQDIFVEVDQRLIERALLNILANSARYVGDSGTIILRVKVDEAGILLEVQDDGSGIAEEHLPHIFDRFYQGHHDIGGSGSGIGLALVRSIIELHGGEVRASSGLGHGTIITCILPHERLAEGQVTLSPTQDDLRKLRLDAIRDAGLYRFLGVQDALERGSDDSVQSQGASRVVLLVEDNLDMMRFLTMLLSADYQVLAASNGREGLKIALERKPDLIISDIMMDEMDGLEFARQLRQDEHGAKIPLIFLSARVEHEDRILGRQYGADLYLVKPFSSDELLAAAKAVLRREERSREAADEREDEALVFMASGIAAQVEHSVDSVRAASLRAHFAERDSVYQADLEAAVGELDILAKALRELSDAGRTPFIRPGLLDVAVESALARIPMDLRQGRSLVLSLNSSGAAAMPTDELVSILEPLLMRALTVTPKGHSVQVKTQVAENGRELLLSIRDEGPGMLHDQVERLYFPFAGLRPHGRPQVQEGLSFTRVRRVVRARGGTLRYDALPELGGQLSVRLPRAEIPEGVRG